MDAEQLAKLRLARAEGVGPVTFRRLLSRFGNAQNAITNLPGLAKSSGRAPVVFPSQADLDQELAQLHRIGGKLLLWDDPDYPALLKMLDSAPPALAMLGDPACLSIRSVAIVGGRNASSNGKRIAESLAISLAEAGICVVSGLARGVDSAAHRGALEKGRTVAAVAGGLDQPYPPENARLQEEIVAAGGLILAESPLGTKPLNRHFPRRNRIIAGLSIGVVVVEAARHSGSLITARLGLENGRELFAVPGSPLDPRTAGSNDLIRQGAHLTETIADILDNLPPEPSKPTPNALPLFSLPTEQAEGPEPRKEASNSTLLSLLSPEPMPIDLLVRELAQPVATVMAALLDLELDGKLEILPGNRVVLSQ